MKHLRQAAQHQRETYDIKAWQHRYDEGQLVWYINENRRIGVCQKLQQTYLGLFVIRQKNNDLIFNVHLGPNDSRVVLRNKLKMKEKTNQNG